jgi:glycerol-3-phosphate dehydrogenase
MDMAKPLLIIGAGINGAALARELALNGQNVVVVDRGDLASGTTAYSSRLIHGGLRYLEHGDFALVRESLEERTRLLRLAPDFVRPLRFFIPVEKRFGGLWAAARDFLGFLPRRRRKATQPRGMVTVKMGLAMYDRYARDATLPKHAVHRVGHEAAPSVNRERYRWLCAYSDAQIVYPERFTLALLTDARRAAAEFEASFELHTYSEVRRKGRAVEVVRSAEGAIVSRFEPAAIVNATGAWVDHTLVDLGLSSPPLLSGTKGSHFVTRRRDLVEALDGRGIYAEAGDGRPVFVLPFGSSVLVGTTDIPYQGDPDAAVASPEELRYLLALVNEVFPQIGLSERDIEMHYAGVRPLPAVGPKTPAAITRRHWLHEHEASDVPLYSIVGGKLTTCRSLAEAGAIKLVERLGGHVERNSQERPLKEVEAFAEAMKTRPGTTGHSYERLDGTDVPVSLAEYATEHEWAQTLDDLVERRLMLLFHHPLTRRCLEQLARVLAEQGRLDSRHMDTAVSSTIVRLRERFGKAVV